MPARSAIDILNDLGSWVWSPSFEAYRSSGALRNLGNPVGVVALILSFIIEVDGNGIIDFLGNSTGRFAHETVEALRQINCHGEARTLSRIIDVAEEAGMTHEAVQRDLERLELFAVGTFSEFHGDKWDSACDQIQVLHAEIEQDQIRKALESFIESNRFVLEAALEGPRTEPS